MTKTAKPIWWRNEGDWHHDSNLETQPEARRERLLHNGDAVLFGDCGSEEFVEYSDICRTAPPVADQCKRCRAAREKQKGATK